MIDFEDAQSEGSVRIAQGKRIEPRSHNCDLTDTTRNSSIQTILAKTAAGRHEHAHLPLRGISGNSID